MVLSRKELLKRAFDTGAVLFGSSALFEIIAAEDISKKNITAPGIKNWVMIIDIPECVKAGDCTDCITACNASHNVPEISNKKHEIKWIWKDVYKHAFPVESGEYTNSSLKNSKFPLMCNHCENPSCVRVCPTQSTWKRSDGIVMMDMHRCIGCRYCMAACPYGSRSFNWSDPKKFISGNKINPDYPARTKGVVEKCSFCPERVDIGLNPFCVDACKNKAMIFGNIADPDSEIRKVLNKRFAIRRKVYLGTEPKVYYLV